MSPRRGGTGLANHCGGWRASRPFVVEGELNDAEVSSQSRPPPLFELATQTTCWAATTGPIRCMPSTRDVQSLR